MLIRSWLQAEADALGQAFDADRLGHAPLLHGPTGLGKSELADWLIARILCHADGDQRPCGGCRSCLLLAAGTHPDLFVADVPEDKTQITVDIIREMCAGLQLTPAMGRHRVGLVRPADRMNTNAANALLKTLEEPSAKTWLILVTDRPDRLPATVRSRCQQRAVRPPDRDTARRWLQSEIADSDPEAVELALALCGDAPLKALAMIREGRLATGLDIRQGLLDLAAGKPLAAGAAEAWAAQPQESWDWIAHWIRHWLAIQMGIPPDLPVPDLPGTGRAVGLAGAWQRALEARALAETSIRADLLLGKWLLEWQALFAADG